MTRSRYDARLLVAALAAMFSLALPVACGSGLFVCDADQDCAGADAGGLCEAQGWCSFADPACPTGQRFGDRAGDGLAGTCVPNSDGTTGTDDTTGPGTTVGSDSLTTSVETTLTTDPTIATLEGGIDSSSEGSSGVDTDPAMCGDGQIGPGEQCDDGDANGTGGACRADCQLNVCGDGVVDPTEECDSKAPDGDLLPCASIGYVGGNYTCFNCMLDVSACEGCGPNGCSYAECENDNDCDNGERCFNLDHSFCTAACNNDDDCTGEAPQACGDVKGDPSCVAVCENNPCPEGLQCSQQFMPAICV